MTSIKTRRFICLLLLTVLLLTLPGCRSPQQTEQEAFAAFLDDLFVELVTDNTIYMRYTLKGPEAYGIDRGEPYLGDYSPEKLAAMMRKEIEIYVELLTFDRALLTRELQQEFDVLAAVCAAIPGEEFLLYENILSPLTSVTAEFPMLLAEMPFYTREDIDEYLLLLADTPRMFDEIAEYVRAQSEAGLFMPDSAADLAIEQLTSFAEQVEQNILVVSFDERIGVFADLTEEERETYKQDNLAAVKEYVLPAHTELADVLESLKGTGTNEGGVSGFPNGARYYEELVHRTTGLSESADEIFANVEEALAGYNQNLTKLLDNNPDIWERLGSLDFGGTDPEALLLDLEERIAPDFPALPDVSYTVKHVPEAMQEYSSPAFYLTPPVDDATENSLYINDAWINPATFYTLLAHEGYPGHLYQTNYSQSRTHPVRSMLDLSGYQEGWAYYAGEFGYDWVPYRQTDPVCADYARLDELYSMAFSAWLDIGVHYKGWTVEEALKEAEAYGANPESIALTYDLISQDAGYFLRYFASYLKIEELREKAEAALGGEFSLMEFHRTVLDAGPAYFEIVEQAVDGYIAERSGEDGVREVVA